MKKLLASVSLAMFYVFSQAQTAPPTGPDSTISPSSSNLWTQPESEIPYRITTIAGNQLALYNPQSSADLLGSTGEIFIQKNSPGGGIPLIRGLSSNRQIFMVDDVRLTTAVSLSGNQQNMMAIDPYLLSSSEVRYGPGAVSEGSDASGGIIGFETLKPQLSMNSKALISGNAIPRFSSANNEYSGHIDINAGWKKWAMVTSLSHYNFNNIRMGSHGPDEYLCTFYAKRQDGQDIMVENPNPYIQHPTGYSQTNLVQKFHIIPDGNWDVNYGFYLSRSSETPHYDKLLIMQDSLPLSAESYYGPQLWIMNHLSASYKWPSTLCDRLDISVAHQYFKDSRTDRNFGEDTRYRREEIINSYTINLDMLKCVRQGHQLTYGMEIIYDKIRSEGSDENIYTGEMLPGPGSYAQTGWGSYGLYITYRFCINSKMNIDAGVRYNMYLLNATFDTNFYTLPFTDAYVNNDGMTGNLGFVLRPDDKWLLNANLSTGLHSPNADDIGRLLDSDPGSVVVPNPHLKSEYAVNLEIGVSKIFGEFAKFYLTGYSTYLDRALVCRDYTLNSNDSILFDGEMNRVKAIQNASHAMIFGLQAGFDATLPLGFGIYSRLNYQKGWEKCFDGISSPLHHAAPFFGKAALTYSTSKFSADLYALFCGKVSYENMPEEERSRAYLYTRDDDGNPFAPAWCTLNLKAHYQISKVLSCSGGIENLTDLRYRPYGSGITSPGINFILSLKASF